MTDQSMDTTNAQLGEPMSFIRVTYRSMGEWLLTGAEITQSQLHHQPHPSMGNTKLRNLEHTAQPAGTSTIWRMSSPSDSSLNLFQAAQLLSASSRQLVWSQESSLYSSPLIVFTVQLPSVRGDNSK